MKSLFVLFLCVTTPIIVSTQIQLPRRASSSRMQAYIDSLRRDAQPKPGEHKNIIVEFTEAPMFLARRNAPGARTAVSADRYLPRFAQLAADADALRNSAHAAPTDHVAIRHQYYRAFFGASMTVPAWMLPMLLRLPYVKAVHPDREVRATIEPAIELIGATAVWETFGTQGEGVRIGIMDSGIDYLHPALGGGFGPGFKVAGGYDVVNNDSDPMDDNGHGTHVAGIVAANADTVKGVAPLATLYAYKVLDAAGRGLDGDVIAAIEWIVDPDQNGDDADRLDAVNVSLGSEGGEPTDPASVAVNNAAALGVTFCVAAGNSGFRTPVQGKEDNYFYDGSATISSPGSAERAITVGASDLLDIRASFSSEGPNRMTFSIKPDVLAPGVDITSTFLAAGYTTLTGTSMATPMVTGVAGLLKTIHPSWTPAMIKSAIMNKAKNLGLSAYLQGGGRVQAVQAASAQTLVIPSALSYGLDDPAAATWTAAETLTVFNISALPQAYAALAAGTSPGISLNVSPSSFAIPAGDSLMVVATLSVDNALVPVVEEDILRFTGRVIFNGSTDTAVVPWAFVRTNRLVVTTSDPDPFFLGYSPTSFILSIDQRVNWTSPTRAEVYAPVKGTYEFFSLFPDPAGPSRIVIDEGVSINTDAAEVFLDAAQAVHPLIFHGVDHQGTALSAYRAPRRALMTSLPDLGDWTTTFSGTCDTVLISNAPASHSFKPVEFQIDLVNTMTFHIIQFDRFTGMTGERLAVNSPGNFLQEHFRVKVPPGTTSAAQVTQIWSYADFGGTGGFSGTGADLDTFAVSGDEYAFTGYFGKSAILAEDMAVKFYSSYADVPGLSLDYESPFIMPYGDSIVAMQRNFVTPAVPRFESGATMTFGGAPVSLLMLWYNNSFGTNTLHFQTFFRGMLRENRYRDVVDGTYTVFDKNGAELFTKSLGEPRGPLQLTADPYRVVVTSSDYWLRTMRGTVTVSSEFDLGDGFPASPPSVTSFLLLDTNGRPTDTFAKDEPAAMRFSVHNYSSNVLPPADSTRAWYREHGTLPWIPLALTEIAVVMDGEGRILQADLGAATTEDSTAVDLRVVSKGADGFTMDHVVAPAFAVGNWDTLVTDVNPPQPGIPGEFALNQNFPNPFNPITTIGYQLPVSGRVILKVYDLLGREVATLVDKEQGPGRYAVAWNASSMPSGMYICKLQARTYSGMRKLLLLK